MDLRQAFRIIEAAQRAVKEGVAPAYMTDAVNDADIPKCECCGRVAAYVLFRHHNPGCEAARAKPNTYSEDDF